MARRRRLRAVRQPVRDARKLDGSNSPRRPVSTMPSLDPTFPLYGTARWKRLRLVHLAREPLCAMCTAEGMVTAATVVDHVTPHRGDVVAFWRGPFQSLCQSHHSSDKQRIENGNKPRVRIGADGWPVNNG